MIVEGRRIAVVGLALVVAGCAHVSPNQGFEEVQRTVDERMQMRIHWIQGTEADQQAAAAVEDLLAEALTPDAAVQVALMNNPELQATYENLMIAQADLVAAGLLRNPIFSAEVKFPEGGGGTNIELGLMQSFLDILTIPLRERMAGAELEAAKMRVSAAVHDLARRTRRAFYNLQAGQQLVEMRRQVLTATDASFELAQRLREAGNITELDLAHERAVYEQSKLDLASAEARVLGLREELNALMGTWGEQTRWEIEGRLPDLPAHDPQAEEMERLAVGQNLELAAAGRQVVAAATRTGLAGPEALLADAQAGVAAERARDGTWSLGPAVSVPVPLWMRNRPAMATAQAEVRRAQQQYASAAVRLRAETRAAYIRMASARQRVEYYQEIMLPLRQRIVSESTLQYNAMQIGTSQLLTAKQEQIRTGAAYIETLRDYWLARTDLEWFVGGELPMPPGTEGPFDPLDPQPDHEPEEAEPHEHGH